MKRRLLFSMLIYLYSMGSPILAKTLDRLILEINGKSYSQRQIEIYLAVRNLAMDPKTVMVQAEPDAWPKAIEAFQNDMLIYLSIENDAEKLDLLQVNSKAIRMVYDHLMERVNTNEKWRDFFKSYHIQDKEVMELLLKMFKVHAFLEWKGVAPLAEIGRVGVREVDVKAEWFRVITRATPHRLYDRARVYQTIEPFGG